jgi:hypothetical protein
MQMNAVQNRGVARCSLLQYREVDLPYVGVVRGSDVRSFRVSQDSHVTPLIIERASLTVISDGTYLTHPYRSKSRLTATKRQAIFHIQKAKMRPIACKVTLTHKLFHGLASSSKPMRLVG